MLALVTTAPPEPPPAERSLSLLGGIVGLRRIGRLEVIVTVPLPANHPQRPTLEKVALNCPVQKSLNSELDIPVTFLWGDDL